MDLPGTFPHRSNKGNSCVFTLHDCNLHATLAEPIKSGRADHLIQACDACCKRLTDAGIKPILHRLDNEVSNALISSVGAKNLDCQLVNTCMHQRNLAERAMQTWGLGVNACMSKRGEGGWWGVWVGGKVKLKLFRGCDIKSVIRQVPHGIHGWMTWHQ